MITTFSGVNNFLLQSELKRRIGEFVAANGDLALERIDCEEADYQAIAGSLQSLPLLAAKKLVVLRQPGAHQQFIDNLENLVAATADATDAIIVEPKLDRRSVYCKRLKKLTEFHEFASLASADLLNWLIGEARARGGDLGAADARYLVERVGEDQQLLSSELDKLLLFDPKITRTNIDWLTEPAPSGNIFQMLDAAFVGDARRALALYDSLRAQKMEPLMILAMLARQLHLLALAKAAGQRASGQIAQEAGLNAFAVQKAAGLARRQTMASIKKLVADLHALDVKIKSSALDADEALKFYFIQLADG